MLSGNAADFYREAPWMILFPARRSAWRCSPSTCSATVLRDYLDPRFKT